jgi:sensor domain CHASE-containing protein
MNEEHIRNLLSSLPREEASDDFTDRVLNRLDSVKRPIYLEPRLALAVSVLLLVAAWYGLRQWQSSVDEQQTNAQIRSIKTEVQQLQNDIRLLRDLAPVLYLGGTENVDFVLDVRQLARETEGDRSQPISYEEADGRAGKGKVYND